MRRTLKSEPGKPPVSVTVRWGDHMPECTKCQMVDLEKTATFALACAEGSPLLMEFLVDRQRPEQKKKEAEVLEWAKRAGVFKL